jgi:transcriptional regulator with XRE-family HTH domain
MDGTEPLLRELVGAVLREERRRQGLTLARLAEASGVSMQHVSDVERGRKDPSSEVLAAIAGALGISVFDIGRRVHLAADPSRDAEPRFDAQRGVVLDLAAWGHRTDLRLPSALPTGLHHSSTSRQEPMLSAA